MKKEHGDATIERLALARALKTAYAIVAKKGRKEQPVCARLSAICGTTEVEVTCSDGEQSLCVRIYGTEVSKPFECAVPAPELKDALRHARAKYVRLIWHDSVDGVRPATLTVVSINDDNTEVVIDCARILQPAIFVERSKPLLLNIGLFRTMLTSVAHATSVINPMLGGCISAHLQHRMLLRITPQAVKMVASDGQVLAITILTPPELMNDYPVPIEMVIPERAVNSLLSLIANIKNEQVYILPGKGAIQLFFTDDGWHATTTIFESKLIAEKYPDYEHVLESGGKPDAAFDCVPWTLKNLLSLYNDNVINKNVVDDLFLRVRCGSVTVLPAWDCLPVELCGWTSLPASSIEGTCEVRLSVRALYNAIANALTDHPRVTIFTARKIARITSDINGYCVCDTFISLRV